MSCLLLIVTEYGKINDFTDEILESVIGLYEGAT